MKKPTTTKPRRIKPVKRITQKTNGPISPPVFPFLCKFKRYMIDNERECYEKPNRPVCGQCQVYSYKRSKRINQNLENFLPTLEEAKAYEEARKKLLEIFENQILTPSEYKSFFEKRNLNIIMPKVLNPDFWGVCPVCFKTIKNPRGKKTFCSKTCGDTARQSKRREKLK